MRTIKFKKVNNNYYSVDRKDSVLVAPVLMYQKAFWVKGPFRKEKRVSEIPFMFPGDANNKYILSGNMNRVLSYLIEKKIPCEFEEEICDFEETKVELETLLPREDQIRLIRKGLEEKQGVIISPTGSGKTIITMGVISAMKYYNILLLAHTIDIVKQTSKKIVKEIPFFKDKIQVLGGGDSAFSKDYRLTVSTIQTFEKQNLKELEDWFDVIIIDEAHHVNSVNSEYGKLLLQLDAPMKIGFTATKPSEREKELSCEGLLGPILGELTNKEAIEKGIIAKPYIKLYKVPYDHKISASFGKYAEIYNSGIVNNEIRNNLIVSVTKEFMAKKESVLILVTRVEHGEILSRMIGCPFVWGSSTEKVRDEIKDSLQNKDNLCVVSSVIWKEGVDMPSLDVVINAAGGKSEIQTIQFIGRGFRVTETKKSFTVVDFFDNSHRFFVEHFGNRLTTYFNMGWM